MLARWFAVVVVALVAPAPVAGQQADTRADTRGDDLAEVEPAAGEDAGGGFLEFLRNLEITRPRLPDRDSDGGGGSGGGGGGDSGSSGGHD